MYLFLFLISIICKYSRHYLTVSTPDGLVHFVGETSLSLGSTVGLCERSGAATISLRANNNNHSAPRSLIPETLLRLHSVAKVEMLCS